MESGPIDNLYIDTNAVLTFVECKRYSDDRIKREVHSQAINYAADLQNMLNNYNGEDFIERFTEIVRTADDTSYTSMDNILDDLAKDPVLENKNLRDWKRQFLERMEFNIKHGVCRIVIACAPDPRSNFSYTQIRNLMKLMQLSESIHSNYDLILMDVRKTAQEYTSKMMWRSYAPLPLIPLIASSRRDTSQRIEDLHNTIEGFDERTKSELDQYIAALDEQGIYTKDNSTRFTLYWQDNNKSLYVQIHVSPIDWLIKRHQIREGETLFSDVKNNQILEQITKLRHELNESSGVHGKIYEFLVFRTEGQSLNDLAEVTASALSVK